MTSDEADDQYERLPVVEGDTVQDLPAGAAASSGQGESGPVPGKRTKPESGEKKTSPAASEILRKMMERGRVSK